MATLQSSLAFSSPASHCLQQSRSHSGLLSWAVHRSAESTFNGQSLRISRPQWVPLRRSSQASRSIKMMAKPKIQFIQGTDEQTIPDVRLTKSKDGTNGVAIFRN
ncbi:putative photosystem II Psb28, class 1 [Rosa chinensis]|uniref:Photosystem II reaction center Psb28 protein n=1 Tax=Rosa chinensis TaxID=74649 RepID=A0A2P6PUV9_ROSCH|nr:putative photosystem II Psb28, class 1 [Rosa chinensis]